MYTNLFARLDSYETVEKWKLLQEIPNTVRVLQDMFVTEQLLNVMPENLCMFIAEYKLKDSATLTSLADPILQCIPPPPWTL